MIGFYAAGAMGQGAAPAYTYEVFTSSGTFNVPAGVTSVDVLLVGGCGGGAAGFYGASKYDGRGGGGGSGRVMRSGVGDTGSATVTVGARGLGGVVSKPQVP